MSESSQSQNQTQKVETEVMKAKPAPHIYKCKRCGKEFTTRAAFNAHIWEHTHADRAAGKPSRREMKTEEIKFTKENKPAVQIGVWDRFKWFIVGGLALLALYIAYLWWRKKNRKEGEEGEGR